MQEIMQETMEAVDLPPAKRPCRLPGLSKEQEEIVRRTVHGMKVANFLREHQSAKLSILDLIQANEKLTRGEVQQFLDATLDAAQDLMTDDHLVTDENQGEASAIASAVVADEKEPEHEPEPEEPDADETVTVQARAQSRAQAMQPAQVPFAQPASSLLLLDGLTCYLADHASAVWCTFEVVQTVAKISVVVKMMGQTVDISNQVGAAHWIVEREAIAVAHLMKLQGVFAQARAAVAKLGSRAVFYLNGSEWRIWLGTKKASKHMFCRKTGDTKDYILALDYHGRELRGGAKFPVESLLCAVEL